MVNQKSTFIPDKMKLEDAYAKTRPVLASALEDIESMLRDKISLASKPTYKSRVKSFNSYYKKILRVKPASLGKQDLPVLTDLMGIRVICAFLEDLDEVQKQIIKNFRIVEIEKKGADMTFSQFGYESLHILIEIPESIREKTIDGIKLPEGLVCEIQVRTILQDAWAEVEHELIYKSEFSPFDLPLRRKLASMNASLSLADIIFQEIRDYQNKLNSEIDSRRSSFYEKADLITRSQLIDGVTEEPVVQFENRNSSLPYVHGTIDDLILDAIKAHNEGNFDRAISIYTQIITAKPEPNNIVLSVIHKHRGMAYFSQNKFPEALSDFSLSVEKDPGNFRSLYYIGIVYGIDDDNEKALEYFNRSLEVNEYQSHVYYRKALAEYKLNRFDEALDDLDKAKNLGLVDSECNHLRELISAKKEMSM